MIYNKFINCQSLNTFTASLKSGEIVDQHVVFIEDVKQIWTNGVFYAASEFSQEDLAMLTKLADVLVMDGDGTKVLTNKGTYIDMPSFSEEESSKLVEISKILVTNGDGTKALMNNGTYVTMPQLNTSDVTSIKNLLSIVKTDGDGTKVLTNNGTYLDSNKLGNENVGSETKHVYFKNGSAIASSTTTGSSTKPVYLNSGSITVCSDSLDVSITGNAATATSAEYITRNRGCNKVTTLASLPIDKDTVVATLSEATEISLSTNMNVGESLTVICTPSASFTQPLPTSGSYVSMDGDSLKVTSGKKFEMNIYCYDTNLYSISCKTML